MDTKFFSPGEDDYDPDLISFIGRMDYYPNQQAILNFCKEVMPVIQARRPATKLRIVGAEPSRDILELTENRGVEVTGTVPDVRPHVLRSALSIAPLVIARGTQNKILESMAMGIPVVCSDVAANGVNAKADDHIMVCRSSDEYVDTVINILDNPDIRQRLSKGGRNRILTSHSWSASMRKLDSIINSVVEGAA